MKTLLVIASGMLVAAAWAQEQRVVVELRDGTRVEGTLVSFDGRTYVVRVGAEERRIAAAEIRQVTFGAGETAPLPEGNLLRNAGFEEALAGWEATFPPVGLEPPESAADRQVSAVGEASARITFRRAFGWCGLSQRIAFGEAVPEAMVVRAQVRTELSEGGVTVLVDLVSDGWLQLQRQAEYVTGTSDWVRRSIEVRLPRWVRYAFVRVGGHAVGDAWFDELSAAVVPAFDVRSAAAGENLLRDGGFEVTQGTFCPYWMPVYPMGLPVYQQGQAQVPYWDIDTQVAREGRHSGQIISTNQIGFNSYTQNVYRLPATPRVRAEGWVRTQDLAGTEGASLVVLFMDDGGEQLDWGMSQAVAAAEWTRIELEREIPEGTAWIVFRAGMNGAGTAWFDDLSLSGVEE